MYVGKRSAQASYYLEFVKVSPRPQSELPEKIALNEAVYGDGGDNGAATAARICENGDTGAGSLAALTSCVACWPFEHAAPQLARVLLVVLVRCLAVLSLALLPCPS